MIGLRLRVLSPAQFRRRRVGGVPVLMAAPPDATALSALVPCVLEQWDDIDATRGRWREVPLIEITDPGPGDPPCE